MTDSVQREVIIVDAGAQARKQHIEELERHKTAPLDEAPQEGGYFIDADGRGAHDAHGNKLPLRPEDAELARKVRAERPGGAEPVEKPKRAARAPGKKKSARKGTKRAGKKAAEPSTE